MTDRPWHPSGSAPEGVIVETKLEGANGTRNEQTLIRRGRLWYLPGEDDMYVYYAPTHWRDVK